MNKTKNEFGPDGRSMSIASECVISLREAAHRLPRISRSGKPVHFSTIYRWATRGVGGVRLEVAKIGGRLVTTTEALERFVMSCTHRGSLSVQPSRMRQRAIDQAERELEALGIK